MQHDYAGDSMLYGWAHVAWAQCKDAVCTHHFFPTTPACTLLQDLNQYLSHLLAVCHPRPHSNPTPP